MESTLKFETRGSAFVQIVDQYPDFTETVLVFNQEKPIFKKDENGQMHKEMKLAGWSLPGGGVRKYRAGMKILAPRYEGFRTGALREMFEETKIMVKLLANSAVSRNDLENCVRELSQYWYKSEFVELDAYYANVTYDYARAVRETGKLKLKWIEENSDKPHKPTFVFMLLFEDADGLNDISCVNDVAMTVEKGRIFTREELESYLVKYKGIQFKSIPREERIYPVVLARLEIAPDYRRTAQRYVIE